MISSSGPRPSLPALTLSGQCSQELAAEASSSGLPGAGIAQRSYKSSDSSSDRALPKLQRSSPAVSETTLCMLAELSAHAGRSCRRPAVRQPGSGTSGRPAPSRRERGVPERPVLHASTRDHGGGTNRAERGPIGFPAPAKPSRLRSREAGCPAGRLSSAIRWPVMQSTDLPGMSPARAVGAMIETRQRRHTV